MFSQRLLGEPEGQTLQFAKKKYMKKRRQNNDFGEESASLRNGFGQRRYSSFSNHFSLEWHLPGMMTSKRTTKLFKTDAVTPAQHLQTKRHALCTCDRTCMHEIKERALGTKTECLHSERFILYFYGHCFSIKMNLWTWRAVWTDIQSLLEGPWASLLSKQ